jgi:hypothetical protein
MPIRAYLNGEGFDPETVRLMGLAFEMALASLRSGCTDPLREALARKIIEIAKTGERDPERLCEGALEDLPTVSPSTLPQPDSQGATETQHQAAHTIAAMKAAEEDLRRHVPPPYGYSNPATLDLAIAKQPQSAGVAPPPRRR